MKKWLSGFLALTMLLSMCVFAPITSAASDPVVSRFAVVSDVHTNPVSPSNTINRLPKVFSTAYAYAESQNGKIDAFVFNGDVIDGNQTSSGYTNEKEFEIFFEGVRDNIRSESKALFAMARTHDIYDGDGNIYYVTESELNSIITDKLGTNGSIIPTADWGYGPHLTMVGGFPVITLTNDIGNGNAVNQPDDGNKNNDDNADNSYHDSEAWLDTTMASLVAENPNRPIFVVYHYPETGKLGWTQRWGQNSLRDTLNKYPQAIAMNAHVHWDSRLSDAITQDLYTEVYDGGIRDVGGPSATGIDNASSPIVSYSIVEVTQSGAVSIKYIDPETGDLLKEANGSGETLVYSIPKAWDKSTYLYTDEAKFAVEKASFASGSTMKLQNGTLTFSRANSEHPIIRYKIDVTTGGSTTTSYINSDYLKASIPTSYSTSLSLTGGKSYTITVTAIDGIYRESANTLSLTCNYASGSTFNGGATTATAKSYAGNGAKGDIDYPDFKNYASTMDADNITNWGISDVADLKAWSEYSKSHSCVGLTFHLENDIDMKDQIFNMIGSVYVPFEGKFDGHLYTISNLLIDDASGMGTGFFVYVKNADIRNFGIKNGLVRGHVSNRKYENAGSYNASTGATRTPFVDVVGVGAIAGRADASTFSHVWNGADVTFRLYNALNEGCFAGLVGRAQNACTFVGCYNTGDVHGFNRASGIANWAQNGTYIARISNCFNLGKITADSGTTEAIARYNSTNASDTAYFSYNNYYLEGSAGVATNRDSNGFAANGAEAPTALTADQVKNNLADLLNSKGATGAVVDNALWATDANGNVYIVDLDKETATYPISEFDQHPNSRKFTISTEAELNMLATLSKSSNLAGYIFTLTDNIDMSNTASFAMIGSGDNSDTTCFAGIFDGAGYTISNLKIDSNSQIGMFFTKGATIKNFTLKNANIKGGRYSGMLLGNVSKTQVADVHIVDSYFAANAANTNTYGGIAGYVYKAASAGGASTFTRCSVEGSTFDFATNGGVGVLIGEFCGDSSITDCYVINNTVTTLNKSGLITGYTYGGTIDGCFTYGNTFVAEPDGATTATSGIVAGQVQTGATAVKNSIFAESDWDVYGYTTNGSITFENTYTLCSAATAGTVATAAQLASGELGYKTGIAMKDGNLVLANGTNAAPVKLTYVASGQTIAVRYSDYKGDAIGEAVAYPEGCNSWDVATDANGDKTLTAQRVYDANGTYPIADFESYINARKFTISSEADLNKLATLSKSNNFAGYTFTLTTNIDMSNTGNFAMIGTGDNSNTCFAGTFDGAGYTISNLKMSSSSQIGMFLPKNATIKNFTLKNADVRGGRYSGIVIGSAANTQVSDVHIIGAYFNPSDDIRTYGGIAGYAYNAARAGGESNFTRCSVQNSNFDCAPNGGVGLIVGEYCGAGNITDCYVIGNTVSALNRSGLLVGYSYGGTIDGCFTYGNTFTAETGKDIQYPSGIVAGQVQTGATTVKDSIFCETDWDVYGYTASGSVAFTNCYTLCSAATAGTVATAAQLASGELGYKTGIAMKDGNLVLANSTNAAPVKCTYVVDGETVATRYTDYKGDAIGEAVALPEGYESWATSEADNGDKTLTACKEYDPNAIYPISERALYPQATKFSVSTPAEFKIFADMVTAREISSEITIYQTANIDLSAYPNLQVGVDRSEEAAFAGTYDGQNHTISGYTYSNESALYSGLFKGLTGTIKNLVIDGASVTAQTHSAILVGETYGTANLIDNVHIKGSALTVKARRAAFLLYGFSSGSFTVKNCSVSDCTMNTGTTVNNPVGLVVTKADGSGNLIENTYVFDNDINVQATGTSFGEIAGDGRGVTITNCGSFGNTFSGTSASYIGMVASGGSAGPIINNSYTTLSALCAKGTFTGCYTGVTTTEIADGSLAYKLKTASSLNWVEKDNYAQIAAGSAVTKYTYEVNGATYATRYTDSTGAIIGSAVALPEGYEKWIESAQQNGDKLFTAKKSYDVNGTYPIADFEEYSNARKFTISTEADLNKLATLSKSSNLAGYTFTLTTNIDMSNTASFAMIGSGDNSDTTCFAGTFDGAGYTISNLKIDSASQIAMFFTKGATIKNFTLKNANIKGGRYSGMLLGNASNTQVSDVHIVDSYFAANDTKNTYGGIAGYVYNAARGGGASNFTRCSVEGSTFDFAANGGVGVLFGEYCGDGSITDCYVINNTVTTLNKSGLIAGYIYGGTVSGCYTYGNTFVAEPDDATTATSGIVAGQVQTGETTVINGIFCEAEWDVYGYLYNGGTINVINTYSLCASATAGTPATAEQLESGELAYKTGHAMKEGKVILADEDNATPVMYTYVVNNKVYATIYTDYAGNAIGTVADPEIEGYAFNGWVESPESIDPDKLFIADLTELDNKLDINGDGDSNAADVITLLKHVNGSTGSIDADKADVNGDGKISLADALRLLKMLSA